MIFILIYRLFNDVDLYKILVLGFTGLAAHQSQFNEIITQYVPVVTCLCVVVMTILKSIKIIQDIKSKPK